MAQEQTLDQTDRLILYLVKNLTEGMPHLLVESGGVLTTMLAKLLFLVDVSSMETSGNQATHFRYIRYKHGPYPIAQFEKRLDSLRWLGLQPLPKVTIEDERPYRIYRLTEKLKVSLDLPPSVKLLADEVMITFANQPLKDVLEYVYSLDFVRNVHFGQEIDLRTLQPREDDILTRVLASFQRELSCPLSKEHLAALEQVKQEPSNENIELARTMFGKQRKAFQLKQGS